MKRSRSDVVNVVPRRRASAEGAGGPGPAEPEVKVDWWWGEVKVGMLNVEFGLVRMAG